MLSSPERCHKQPQPHVDPIKHAHRYHNADVIPIPARKAYCHQIPVMVETELARSFIGIYGRRQFPFTSRRLIYSSTLRSPPSAMSCSVLNENPYLPFLPPAVEKTSLAPSPNTIPTCASTRSQIKRVLHLCRLHILLFSE